MTRADENDLGPTPVHIQPGVPGFRRNQLIDPHPGRVRADVEDNIHHFWVEIEHDGMRVLALRTGAVRQPWTTCDAAGAYLSQRMTGARLDELASVDSALSHCTHQYDLALLAAAHASDSAPTLYSTFASDQREPVQHAELYRNGIAQLSWDIAESEIVSPGLGHGLSLRKLRQWEQDLSADEREMARILRRAVFTSGARLFDYSRTPTADKVVESIGACFTFQPERAAGSRLMKRLRDFDNGDIPLAERIEDVRGQARGA